jgi:hypothetical protein
MLVVHTAIYGDAVVTDTVQSLIKGDRLIVRASNEIFGDPWVGTQKTLVVVYELNGQMRVKVAVENETLKIDPQDTMYLTVCERYSNGVYLTCAIWGLSDVSQRVLNVMITEYRTLKIQPQQSIFSRAIPNNHAKTLFLLYRFEEDETYRISIIREGNMLIMFPFSNIKVVSAHYGPKDVTSMIQVRDNKHLNVKACNEDFGDPQVGVLKRFTIIVDVDGRTHRYSILEHQSVMISACEHTKSMKMFLQNMATNAQKPTFSDIIVVQQLQ